MFSNPEALFQWLTQYAYQPNMVYLCVFCVMIASGFGFPVPEEVTIVSVGLLTYMGAHPKEFPPPYPGAPVVHGYEAAVVTLLSVVFADLLVFSIGRIFGRKIVQHPRLTRVFSPSRLSAINQWVAKWGSYAVFFFRFTPGIRFPAHVILGMSGLYAWQFALVDGFAALISVPTQIVLIYHFGEPILKAIHDFKLVIGGLILVVVLYLLVKKLLVPWIQNRRAMKQSALMNPIEEQQKVADSQ